MESDYCDARDFSDGVFGATKPAIDLRSGVTGATLGAKPLACVPCAAGGTNALACMTRRGLTGFGTPGSCGDLQCMPTCAVARREGAASPGVRACAGKGAGAPLGFWDERTAGACSRAIASRDGGAVFTPDSRCPICRGRGVEGLLARYPANKSDAGLVALKRRARDLERVAEGLLFARAGSAARGATGGGLCNLLYRLGRVVWAGVDDAEAGPRGDAWAWAVVDAELRPQNRRASGAGGVRLDMGSPHAR